MAFHAVHWSRSLCGCNWDPRMQISDRLGRPVTLCEGQVVEAILR